MVTVSIIIPVYNEEHRLKRTFSILTKELPKLKANVALIFVNDGSTDTSLTLLREFSQQTKDIPIQIYSYRKNQGKGYALKRGCQFATGDYVLFTDADFSTPLSTLNQMLELCEGGAELVYGVRKKYTKPWYRVLLSRLFTNVRNVIFPHLSDIRDSQCGFKCLSKELAHSFASMGKVSGFLFDIELFELAKQLNFKTEPYIVQWEYVHGSRVINTKLIPSLLRDMKTLIHWKKQKRASQFRIKHIQYREGALHGSDL